MLSALVPAALKKNSQVTYLFRFLNFEEDFSAKLIVYIFVQVSMYPYPTTSIGWNKLLPKTHQPNTTKTKFVTLRNALELSNSISAIRVYNKCDASDKTLYKNSLP